jgi:hypothetical protein
VDVVLAVDDDLLLVLQDFRDDNVLVRHVAGDAIGVEKVDCVEQLGFQIIAQLIQRRPIQLRPAVPIVDVFLDE